MTNAEQLAKLASEIPEHLPPRLRVLVLVWRASLTMRYSPYLLEVADALGRASSTLTNHIAALADDRLVVHLTGSRRVAITYTGAAMAQSVVGDARDLARQSESTR